METKMPKKTKSFAVPTVEVLSPAEPDIKGALERMVERKIAEMKGDSQRTFEPFFQAKAIMHAIRKLETIPQQRKWQYYFEEWDCLPCQSRKKGHHSLGMCAACHHKIFTGLAAILRRTSADRPEQRQARDLQDVARESLRSQSSK
jgi:hypothetical protein